LYEASGDERVGAAKSVVIPFFVSGTPYMSTTRRESIEKERVRWLGRRFCCLGRWFWEV
jgi:hypothetical protein